MRTAESHLEAILVPGDLAGHFLCFENNEPWDPAMYQRLKNVMANYTRTMAEQFPEVPIIFTPGNNDYLYNYQAPDIKHKEDFYSFLYDLWISSIRANKRADTPENRGSFTNFGSYTFDINDQLTVISFNSMYFSRRNNEKNDPKAAEDLMVWLEEQLTQAEEQKRHILLLYHLPNGQFVTPVSVDTYWVDKYQARLHALLPQYSHIVSQIVTGHTHISYLEYLPKDEQVNRDLDSTRIAARNYADDQCYGNQIVNRAMSPFFQNNPGFGLLYFDGTYDYPKEYQEYTFLLSRSYNYTHDPLPLWVFLYSSSEDLGIKDLSARNIRGFFKSLVYDPNKLLKYMLIKLGNRMRSEVPEPSPTVLSQRLCSHYSSTPLEIQHCANQVLARLTVF